MKRPALQNKQGVLLRMAFRARKVLGTFEKRTPEPIVIDKGSSSSPLKISKVRGINSLKTL